MRIDSIKLPFIESNNKISNENVSTEKKTNKEENFASVLSKKERKNEVQTEIKVEETVENNLKDVDNYNLEVDKYSEAEDINESDIEELVNTIYPIVIDFIKFYKENLVENNSSLSNGIVVGETPETLKNMISQFVDTLPNLGNIQEKVQDAKVFSSELMQKFIIVPQEESNIESITNEPISKEFIKSLVEEVVKNVNPIATKDTNINQGSIENAKNNSRELDKQFNIVEKNIGEALAKLTNEDDVKLLVKNTLKEIIKDNQVLVKDTSKQFGKVFESYIPTKHVYVNEDGKQLNVKVNEVQSQEVKAVAISTSDEELFLKSIIDGEEKVTKSDFVLRNDTKMFTPLNESNKTEQTPVINRQTMINDVIKAIKYMERNAQKELTVKIYPKELGEISIKIIAGAAEGGIKASITATSKETYAILNSNINELKQNIANSEIKISEVNISLYNQDTTFYRDETNQEYKNNNGQSLKKDNSEYKDIEEIDDMLKDTNPLGNLSMLV